MYVSGLNRAVLKKAGRIPKRHLELIHTDVFELFLMICPGTVDGFKTFFDAYKYFTAVYLLKHKSKISIIFLSYYTAKFERKVARLCYNVIMIME